MEKYWLIACSEDGEVRVEQLTKPALLERLNDKYYGNISFFGPGNAIPADPQTWERNALLLKGDVAVPFAKEKVVEYDVK